MKKFKKLAALLIAATLSLGLVALTACNNGDKGNSSTPTESSATQNQGYEITVLKADGTKATDVKVQLCTADMQMCYQPAAVDANGSVMYTCPAGEYVIHVWSTDMQTEYELSGNHNTTAEYGAITVTIAE